MNPLTNMKNVKKLSEQELHRSFKTSWHDQYKDSAWIFVGGLPYDLTEGDIISIFSQYGEVVNINLVRDKATGKQKGFCFICYEDQRSTVLAVDNFNGIKILKRTIRVDHVSDYKMPKEHKNSNAETRKLHNEGCGPDINPEKKPSLPIPSTELPAFAREEEAPPDGFKLPPRLPIGTIKVEPDTEQSSSKKEKMRKEKKRKKGKKSKKNKSRKKHKKESTSESSSSDSTTSSSESSTEACDREDEKTKKQIKEFKLISKENSARNVIDLRKNILELEQVETNRKHKREDDEKNRSYRNSKRSMSDGIVREERTYDSNEDDRLERRDKQCRRVYDEKYNEIRHEDGKYRKHGSNKNPERKNRMDDRREIIHEDAKRYRR